MLQATCQGRFKFLGIKRVPGDVITSKELATALEAGTTTMTAINALKGNSLILLSDDEAPVSDGANVDRSLAQNAASIHDKLDAIMAHFKIVLPAKAAEAKPAAKRSSGRKAA